MGAETQPAGIQDWLRALWRFLQMANSLLSPTIIAREALRILHANLNFIDNIDKQYDPQFANSGASPSGKIGPSLTIRMPNKYTVRTGAVLSVQDTVETSQVLTVSTQKGVDTNFTTVDLTLTIDEFSRSEEHTSELQSLRH